ncbi:MAG: diphosphomevalonate decarboxylase [Gammaproteobacteria bacterium]
MQAAARARSNIALVKYWGKRQKRLNLPAVGSVSITLEALASDTQVTFDTAFEQDDLVLDGERRSDQLTRVSQCLDILRDIAGTQARAHVTSTNNFPTAAGLASSASGFAALVAAADSALGLGLSSRELSIVARRGSGSAARSIFGGFVEMHPGRYDDGTDCYAEPLLDAREWPLEVVVAVTAQGPKAVSSGSGMARSAETSPYYAQWVATHPADMNAAHVAIAQRDFDGLATVSESSCLKMHAAAMATRPPLVYWNGVTVECMHAVTAMRRSGVPVFFTIDAGPQLKAICAPDHARSVQTALGEVPGVIETLHSGLGPGVEVLSKAA